LLALNPEIEIVAHQLELRAANVLDIFRQYDLVLDGTDRFATRYLSNDACVILGKPLISAAIHRFEGQAMTYVPGQGPCYRCLFPEPPADGLVPNCAEAGVLGVLPGVLGTIQATEAIKLIVGAGDLLIGRLLTYDALGMRFAEFAFQRRPDCAVCGDHPTITAPQDPAELCSADALAAIRKLSAHELHALLNASPDVLIVDVREPKEFAGGHLARALNIPVSQLRERLADIQPSAGAVFVCRSGARSLAASALAANAGVSAMHLEGGLLSWAATIDPGFHVSPVG
jgi:adenylyltransferase/sulfurtransferase